MRISPSRRWLPFLLVLACTPDPEGTDDAKDDDPVETDETGGSTGDPRLALALPAPRNVLADHAATADTCAECHSNEATADAMRDADGAPIGPYDLQHGTMMANAGRDPLFWAVYSAEVASAPDLEPEIGDTCFRCHAPMAHADAVAAADPTPTDDEIRAGADDRALLGLDGVTCVACHKATDADLGDSSTFTGRYTLDRTGKIFGPHAAPFVMPMQMHTGWTPTQSGHVTEAAACSACHTLQTHTVVDGALTDDVFLEQSPYLEWRNSAYTTEGGGSSPTSCQDCHLPTVDTKGRMIRTEIARRPSGGDFPPVDPRSPFGRHLQVGGNALMLGILRDNADVLQPVATSATLDTVIDTTRSFLQTAASVAVVGGSADGGDVAFDVVVTNLTGHKLPTGYPSRRMWLELEVVDADGQTAFAVGGTDASGRLVDGAGAPLPEELAGGPVRGHRDVVGGATDVVTWQLRMADADGTPVFRLLAAAQPHRDDRLLPTGWNPANTATDVGDIGAVGVDGDDDFVAGSDTVHVALQGLTGRAPFQVTATLRYQPVAPRWVDELALVDTPEVGAFLAMWDAADRTPEVLATDTATVD